MTASPLNDGRDGSQMKKTMYIAASIVILAAIYLANKGEYNDLFFISKLKNENHKKISRIIDRSINNNIGYIDLKKILISNNFNECDIYDYIIANFVVIESDKHSNYKSEYIGMGNNYGNLAYTFGSKKGIYIKSLVSKTECAVISIGLSSPSRWM